MGDLVRTLKLEPIWIDPEDKLQFNKITYGLMAKDGKKLTQADTFKVMLAKYKGVKNDDA